MEQHRCPLLPYPPLWSGTPRTPSYRRHSAAGAAGDVGTCGDTVTATPGGGHACCTRWLGEVHGPYARGAPPHILPWGHVKYVPFCAPSPLWLPYHCGAYLLANILSALPVLLGTALLLPLSPLGFWRRRSFPLLACLCGQGASMGASFLDQGSEHMALVLPSLRIPHPPPRGVCVP